MKRYSRAELVAFLRRVAALLAKREVLEVIGGAAAVLKYGARAPTKDIDTWNRVPKAVQDAADAVGAAGQGVPLAPAGVAEIPNDAELRFKTVHYVAKFNQLAAAEAALAKGARLAVEDRYGNQPLLTAVLNDMGRNERIEMVKLFMSHGADPDHKNRAGRSPRGFAQSARYDNLRAALRMD